MDDTRESLEAISARYKRSIVSMLLDVQQCQIQQPKSLSFLKNLECLHVKRGRDYNGRVVLGRRHINAIKTQNYVAASYTWEASEGEISSNGGYFVEPRQGSDQGVSEVRDCVFRRLIKYLTFVGVENLWIDRENIDQDDKETKQIAMQAMDLVYSRSKQPVALLSKPIRSAETLNVLTRLLRGHFVTCKTAPFKLNSAISQEEAWKAIELLQSMTSDRWWTRAWTFQEDYRASTRMVLLIPHDHCLETKKLSTKARSGKALFGKLQGELMVNSANFREVATKLCLAFQCQTEFQRRVCEDILARAAKYTILLQNIDGDDDDTTSRSMSPYIISDIGARKLKDLWDRLPITANCCRYPVRLDSGKLKDENVSVSVSILALCLLNGEIFENSESSFKNTMRHRNIYQVLKNQCFRGFQAPVCQELTFIKGCRFIDVQLTQEGIRTKGHLWKLGKMIPTRNFPILRSSASRGCGPAQYVRCRLRQLAQWIARLGYRPLARHIHLYLRRNSERVSSGGFTQWYQDLMASEVVAAIDSGKCLRLGCLAWPQTDSSYRAIFVTEKIDESEEEEEDTDEDDGYDTEGTEVGEYVESEESEESEESQEWVKATPDYCFTAFRAERPATIEDTLEDIDKHVSLEVDVPNLTSRILSRRPPQLFIKQWANGLCFFSGYPQDDVLFPYPPSLVGM